jgi:hypothetical protein
MKSFLLLACVALFAGFGDVVAQDKPAPLNPASTDFSGKVVETMNASSYTYVLLDTGTAKLWVAAPRFYVKVGDSAAVMQAMAMLDYHSKTMNRDFDVVYFTGSITLNGKPVGGTPPETAELPKNHPSIGGADAKIPDLPKNHPPIGGAPAELPGLPPNHPPIGQATATPIDFAGIKTVDGGKTVADIVTKRDELAGTEVAVRGKVVKYNGMVMGKNWLHIRDGSGSEGSNDLTITTAAPVKVGDTVLVKGKVVTNRDFGAGYKYSVIIEDGQVTVE